ARTNGDARAGLLGPVGDPPALGVRNEVPLLRRIARDEARTPGSRTWVLQPVVGRAQPAPVGDVLTLRELAVHVEGVDLDVLVELTLHERGLFDEVRRIRRLPPVAQVARGVVVPAFVIEAVRQLVTGPATAQGAVVRAVVRARIERLRHERAGRKHHLVLRRIVIRVDRGDRDAPFGRIDGRPRPVHRALPLERVRPRDVQDERSPGYPQPGIVPPPVGIPDLLTHARELVERLGARRIRHPREVQQATVKRRANVVDHGARAGARLRWERLGDVRLAECLAEVAIRLAQQAPSAARRSSDGLSWRDRAGRRASSTPGPTTFRAPSPATPQPRPWPNPDPRDETSWRRGSRTPAGSSPRRPPQRNSSPDRAAPVRPGRAR